MKTAIKDFFIFIGDFVMLAFLAIIAAILLLFLIGGIANAGSITLGWNTYTNGNADTIQAYAVPGTNTAFSGANVSQWVQTNVPITAITVTIDNLAPGAWTCTAAAYNSTNGLQSSFTPTVWTNVPSAVTPPPPPPPSTNPPAPLSGFKILKASNP